jgi:hypothetical protein
MDGAEPEGYANIRKVLGSLIGRTVVDVTQHDQDEWEEARSCYVMLMFDDGQFVKFPIGDEGFEHNSDDNDSATAATGT